MDEYENLEKSHGRIVHRKLRTAYLPAEYLGWKGVCQVFELKRVQERGGKLTQGVTYGITSLSADNASAEHLLYYMRRHWAIENELHNVRDTTFDEDRCRVRIRNKAQILATIRNATITLLRHAGFANITEGREWCSLNPERAIKFLRRTE